MAERGYEGRTREIGCQRPECLRSDERWQRPRCGRRPNAFRAGNSLNDVLLVGVRGDAGFAELRTRHFESAIIQALGSVRVVDFRDDVAAAVQSRRPTAVVTASNYGPTKAALVAVAGQPEIPLWVDVAGDPFAEAQAYAATLAPRPHAPEVSGEEEAQPRVPPPDVRTVVAEDACRVWRAAYLRADAFSVVCGPGRHAVLGALGVLGRLPLFALGEEPVAVMPVAMEFWDGAAGAARPGNRVVLVGGFNTWFDDEVLLAGLLRAMERAPFEVVVCGGGIAGHYEAGFARFCAGVAASRHASRFSFPGWVPSGELPGIVDAGHVTVVLDRPGPEAELGSRTRLLYAVHRGLRILATTCSPLAQELAGMGLLERLPAASEVGAVAAAAALADKLAVAGAGPTHALQSAAKEKYSLAATTAPLRTWVANPNTTPRPGHDAVAAGLAAEVERLRGELAGLRASPTYRLLDGIKRRVGRG